ncbi:MAG: hypothetical protein ACKVZH_06380 [Blastocatellia bacterium]
MNMKRLLFNLICACVLSVTIKAHVLDQYLQVTQIALTPDGARIELRLVPGAQVAERVFALIDVDGDGQISSAEEQAYARQVLQDLALEVDGHRAPLALTGIQFPTRHEMNEGNGAIRLNLAVEAALNMTGEHQLFFRNDHLPELGVYLVNAMVPQTDAIKINGQQRDALQHGLRVSFSVLAIDGRVWPGRVWPGWIGALLIGLCLALLLSLFLRAAGFGSGRSTLFHRLQKP